MADGHKPTPEQRRRAVVSAVVLAVMVVGIYRHLHAQVRPLMDAALAAQNRQTMSKLLVIAVAMLGFGFAMVPMYRQICESLGITQTRVVGEREHAGGREPLGDGGAPRLQRAGCPGASRRSSAR